MDYAKIYDSLIERAKNRTLSGYSEWHHILPQCMGGGDEDENLAQLTPEEHFIAHKLLVKIHPDNFKLAFALLGMCWVKNGNRPNNKLFGWTRRRVSEAQSALKKGKKRPTWIIEKLRQANIGSLHTRRHRENISLSLTGRRHSAEHNAKVSAALMGRSDIGMFGRKHSEETKAKMREKGLQRRHTVETRKKLEAYSAGLTQEQRSAKAHKAWETKRRKATLAESSQ
jgi:hypothetical protein